MKLFISRRFRQMVVLLIVLVVTAVALPLSTGTIATIIISGALGVLVGNLGTFYFVTVPRMERRSNKTHQKTVMLEETQRELDRVTEELINFKLGLTDEH